MHIPVARVTGPAGAGPRLRLLRAQAMFPVPPKRTQLMQYGSD